MKNTKKNLLSIFTIIIFTGLAISSTVNKIHYGSFNYDNKIEEKSTEGNYLLKNDGTKVFGNKIKWKSGLLVKDQIQIDDQKYKISEIRGYREYATYYTRFKKEFIKRIVHGKVNVYVMFTEVTTTTTDRNGFSRTKSYTRTDQYGQKGEDGEMIGLAGQKEIKELLSDCPLAVEMISLSNSKIRKAIKKDSNYLNSIFDVYNNGCK